jgi:hypothetical protein
MKTLLVVALMLGAGRAEALDPWTAENVSLEAAFAAAVMVDWRQTHWALDNGHHEMNPLLGAHPTDQRLGASIMGAVAAHAAVSAVLPARWRRLWQAVTLAGEIGAVGWNAHVGTRVTF